MNDEIQKQVEEISENVEIIRIKTGGTWTAFFRGIMTGFGSVVGAFIAILIIGWILNIVGVIPAFKQQAENWRQTFLQASGKQVQTK